MHYQIVALFYFGLGMSFVIVDLMRFNEFLGQEFVVAVFPYS
jgi:hypothetical protein